MYQIKNFINGEFSNSLSKNSFENINPATNEVIGNVPDSNEDDLEIAIQAANNAFTDWSVLSQDERSEYLFNLSELIEKNADELAYYESIDQGKAKKTAKEIDIPRSAKNFRFFAEAAKQYHSSLFQNKQNELHYEIRKAIGVCGLISPWNLPLYLLTWKIAPAIAVGNTCIAKPSEVTPLTGYFLSELIKEAKIPNGVINILHGYGHSIGNAITSDARIPVISFTGGTETGKKVYTNAVESFKKVSLELGGKNPSIVFADADFEKTVETTVRASFTNQGEICLCGSRIYVEERIFEKFVTAFKKRVENLVVANPLDDKADLGAIVSKAHFDKVLSYIKLAKEEGGRIICGGNALQIDGLKGFFIEPTVITGLDQNCRTITEEIFGPVVTISSFKNEDEVISYANKSNYGLAANIFTSNLKMSQYMVDKIDSGIIWVNTWLNRDLRTPFGGMKQSGLGREGGRYSLEFFTKVKSVTLDFS